MIGSAFKLESFDQQPMEKPAQPLSVDDLNDAYEMGFKAGIAMQKAQDRSLLCDALSNATSSLKQGNALRAEVQKQTSVASAQMLRAILDMVMPSSRDERLKLALLDEFQSLAQAGDDAICQISGDQGLLDEVDVMIAEQGFHTITTRLGPTTEITFDGGRITLDAEQFEQRVRALLTELEKDNQ